MPEPRPSAPSIPAPRARAWAAALGAAAILAVSCSDGQLAGTSSGVDNPALTVAFTGTDGAAARVTGDLGVYAADQNPAIDPNPLASIRVNNSALTRITADDFRRAREAASKRAAREGAASAGASTGFNLIFTTQDKNGAFAAGFAYDSAAKAFTRRAEGIRSVSLQPKPLVRYEARIAKGAVHGGDCRVFVPGSPFLATLVDSLFVLEDLPQGMLPLGLIGADGRIYPVPDSLNTADSSKIYRPDTTASGGLDSAAGGIPAFSVTAPPPREAYLDVPNYLEARLTGIAPTDPRLSILWKWVPDSIRISDPDHRGDLGGVRPPPSAEIVSPTSLRTEVRFHGDGVFRFAVIATAGTRSRSDTTLLSIRHLPPPEPKVLRPAPAESLLLAEPYTVQWQLPGRGPYTLEVSVDSGSTWAPLAAHYQSQDGLQIFPWTPAQGLGPSDRCLLRIRDEVDTALSAESEGPFHLVP